MNPYELPLSAYTPGQGDPAMEGGWATASGSPMYTLEMYLRGLAPYVTGATSQRKPSGQVVNRTVGDRVVPVQLSDYGPGVKGLDIATENSKWATNFPYQGQRDYGSMERYQSMAGAAQTSPATTSPATPQVGNMSSGMMGTWADLAKAKASDSAMKGIGSIISSIGGGMQSDASSGMERALKMLQTQHTNPLAQLLQQLAGNPTMYL